MSIFSSLISVASKVDNTLRPKTTTRDNAGGDALKDAQDAAKMSTTGKANKEFAPIRSATVEAIKTAKEVGRSVQAKVDFVKNVGQDVADITGASSLASSMKKNFEKIAAKVGGAKTGNSGLPSKAKTRSQSNQL